jgi:hypothetical protein
MPALLRGELLGPRRYFAVTPRASMTGVAYRGYLPGFIYRGLFTVVYLMIVTGLRIQASKVMCSIDC